MTDRLERNPWIVSGDSRESLRTFASLGKRHSLKMRLVAAILPLPFGVRLAERLCADTLLNAAHSDQVTADQRQTLQTLDRLLHDHWRRVFPGADGAPGPLSYLMEPSRRGSNIFVAARRRPLAFVKHIRHESLFGMLEREHRNVHFLQRTLTGGLEHGVPGACELLGEAGDRFLVFDHVDGDRLSEMIGAGGARDARRTERDIRTAVDWLWRFQVQTTRAWTTLASSHAECEALAAALIANRPDAGPVHELVRGVTAVIGGGTGTALRIVCGHGDFFPGNILVNDHRVSVIDWETMREEAPQTDDLFSFLLSYRLTVPPAAWPDQVLDSFRVAFMDDNWFSRIVVRSIRRYAADTGLAGGGVLEALFVMYLMRQSVLEAEGVMAQKMMASEHWLTRLEYYAAHRAGSIFSGL